LVITSMGVSPGVRVTASLIFIVSFCLLVVCV
jgi:hypothetical protein